MIYDLAIVGGGASGLMAGVMANGLNTIILEKNDRVGKKILATGNGRCNFTNINASIEDYYSDDMEKLEKILDKISPKEIIDIFNKMGMLERIEEDRVYPYSNQASTVLDILRNNIMNSNIVERTHFKVLSIEKRNYFTISSIDESIKAKNVIIAIGGIAGVGDNENLYKIVPKHEITPLYPALVPLKIEEDFCRSMQGIRADVIIKAVKDKDILLEEKGEILFTNYGLSGIATMQISSLFSEYGDFHLEIDFMPEYTLEGLIDLLYDRKEILEDYYQMDNFLLGTINKKLGHGLLKQAGIEKLSMYVSDLKDKDIKNIAKTLKCFILRPNGTTGFKNAQVTRGGLKLKEFDTNMESKLIDGLFATGEALDVNGLCGGYNLHFAWISGILAIRRVRERCLE